MRYVNKLKMANILLRNIKSRMERLKELQRLANNVFMAERAMYRYYHHSYKVYDIQEMTIEIRDELKNLMKDIPLNKSYVKLIKKGTGKRFKQSHNKKWDHHTLPMVEAFHHSKFFLDMAIKYGEELDTAPTQLPEGWGALLHLYNIR